MSDHTIEAGPDLRDESCDWCGWPLMPGELVVSHGLGIWEHADCCDDEQGA